LFSFERMVFYFTSSGIPLSFFSRFLSLPNLICFSMNFLNFNYICFWFSLLAAVEPAATIYMGRDKHESNQTYAQDTELLRRWSKQDNSENEEDFWIVQSKFALKLCNQIVEKRENGMTQQPSQDNLPNIKKESESKMMICLQSFSVVWSTSFCCLVWPSSSSSLIHLHLRVFFFDRWGADSIWVGRRRVVPRGQPVFCPRVPSSAARTVMGLYSWGSPSWMLPVGQGKQHRRSVSFLFFFKKKYSMTWLTFSFHNTTLQGASWMMLMWCTRPGATWRRLETWWWDKLASSATNRFAPWLSSARTKMINVLNVPIQSTLAFVFLN